MTDLKSLIRGNSKRIKLRFTKSGKKENITGWTVYFTAKRYIWQSDDDAAIKKDIVEHTIPLDGETVILLTPDDTKDLEVGSYVFDIKIKTNGNVHTVTTGSFEVKLGVTRR